MSNSVSAVFNESFEDVLIAVQDTARGRWFLNEYAKRQRGQDTTSILAAISKLEGLIGSNAANVDAPQVARAREAIAAAKAKLSAMHNELPALSNEARMFGKLAELSRAAFPGEQSAVARGVDVALSLVQDLDQSFAGVTAIAAKPATEAYFAADQKLFAAPAAKVEAPQAAPVLVEVPKPAVAVAPAPKAKVEEEQPRGAKLTINRIKSGDAPVILPAAIPVVTEKTVAAVAEVAPVVKTTAVQPIEVEPAKSRITIIRRKAEDMVGVPLVDEQPAALSA